jgi:adenylate kinase family enzyme
VPRTFGQKALFDQIFPDYLVVFLDLKQDIAIDRLSNRRIDPENGASFSKDFE